MPDGVSPDAGPETSPTGADGLRSWSCPAPFAAVTADDGWTGDGSKPDFACVDVETWPAEPDDGTEPGFPVSDTDEDDAPPA